MAQAGALATVDEASILERIAAGEFAITIAAELKVHPSALSHRFANRPEYKEARKAGAEVRLETAELEVRSAADVFTLARARETFKTVAWRCEREFPEQWAPRQHITASIAVTNLDALLVTSARELLQTVGQATPNGGLICGYAETADDEHT